MFAVRGFSRMNKAGTVYLVGAGPGDPGLMTLRGAEVLGRADVVVYDALVNPELLRLAPPGAEVIFGGKRAGKATLPQPELNRMLIAKAREGKTVVRLKGGDPYVFGRGAEEALELAEARIPFEVVPGVSSFVAAPAYAGVPLTHRDFSSRITLVTGHGDPLEDHGAIDWAQLARTPGTKVVLMGTERIAQIARTLVEQGMAAETPIALVQWGATGRQRSVSGTLADIGERVKAAGLGPPTVAVIGEVVRLRSHLNWFEQRPLFGRRVVVTRSREQAAQLSRKLVDAGADVLEIPTIRFETPSRREGVVDALLELNSYDWLVFTSPNGVTHFFQYFFRQFKDMRDLGGARIAAVGPGTASKLQELHLQVDLMPEEAIGHKVAEAFARYESIENLRICLLRAEVAGSELPRALEEQGAIVDDIACYRTVAETADPTGAAARFEAEGADWVLFTSASTVRQFHERFPLTALRQRMPGLRFASIGPETTKALRSLEAQVEVEAREHTLDGLVKALIHAARKAS